MAGGANRSGAEQVGRILPNPADPRVATIVQARMRGRSWAEISDELRIPPRTLYQLRHDYDVDAIVGQLNRDAIEALAIGHAQLVAKARAVLLEAMEKGDKRQRLAAALKLYPEVSADSGRRTSKRVRSLPDDELGQRALAALAGRHRR